MLSADYISHASQTGDSTLFPTLPDHVDSVSSLVLSTPVSTMFTEDNRRIPLRLRQLFRDSWTGSGHVDSNSHVYKVVKTSSKLANVGVRLPELQPCLVPSERRTKAKLNKLFINKHESLPSFIGQLAAGILN